MRESLPASSEGGSGYMLLRDRGLGYKASRNGKVNDSRGDVLKISVYLQDSKQIYRRHGVKRDNK